MFYYKRQEVKRINMPDKYFDSDVIVDFIFDKGLFYIAVSNHSDRPVFKVQTRFDQKITGVNGRKDISSIGLFKNIEFLAPRKELRTFLDASSSYFQNKQPEKIKISISYLDSAGVKKSAVISHDLSIYKDIGYIE
jgi:hypothetical protein